MHGAGVLGDKQARVTVGMAKLRPVHADQAGRQGSIALLPHGAEASGTGTEAEAVAEAIKARLCTARMHGAPEWIAAREAG